MKVQKSTFQTESAYKAKVSESIVEGKLSLPVEKNDIGRVLFVHGKVNANTEPTDGKVFMDGNVTFSVVYMSAEGNVDAFESASPFRHTEEMEGAGAGMNVYAKGGVKEVQYTVEDSRTIAVKGIVSMMISSSMDMSCEGISGADAADMQVKMHTGKMACTKDYKKETVVMREDIRVPQSMPRAERILFYDAYAVVKSIKTEELKIIVEGDVKMMILYQSEDKSAPLQYFYESVPFGEIVSSENVMAGDVVVADTDMYDMKVDIAEETSDVFRMYSKMNIMCSIKTMRDVEYLEDAYSLKKKLDVTYEKHSYRHTALSGCTKAIARTAIDIPETEPSVSRVVCMKACPRISAATPGTDRVYLEGLMMYTICYASPEGMWSYKGEVPFEAEAQMEGLKASHDVDVSAEVEYCSFEGAGRDISVKFMMDVSIKAYEMGDFMMVKEMEETEESPPMKKGITIYFADGGESTWDIAKRYSTTLDIVKKFNPDIDDRAAQGQKILIMG